MFQQGLRCGTLRGASHEITQGPLRETLLGRKSIQIDVRYFNPSVEPKRYFKSVIPLNIK